MNFNLYFIAIASVLLSCSSDDSGNTTTSESNTSSTCTNDKEFDNSRGACNETLSLSNAFSMTTTTTNRIISANSIPNHKVGLFGQGQGSLNPNAISEQNESYTITLDPKITGDLIPTLGSNGPDYRFGVLLNGVELDPVAAEPWPHNGISDPNVNWDWNWEALNVAIGLDCNSAHVQPTGKYHVHGNPTLYLEELGVTENKMTLIGYAADGFPIYYKYAYTNANDSSSSVVAMTSSYSLKEGNRPGDGVSAPCGEYTGVYTNDYEYLEGTGTLDETNGRTGVTPEYPNGTYYYVMTDDFPSIPRFFRGTPSNDFAF